MISHTTKSAGRSISGQDWYFIQPWTIWSSLCLYYNNTTKTWLTPGLEGTDFSMGEEAARIKCDIRHIWGKQKAEGTMEKCCSVIFLAELNWPLQSPLCRAHHPDSTCGCCAQQAQSSRGFLGISTNYCSSPCNTPSTPPYYVKLLFVQTPVIMKS